MRRPWIVLITSICIQFAGCTLGYLYLTSRANPSGLVALAIPSVLALVFSLLFNLPRAWVIFNLLVPLGGAAVILGSLPSWIFLLGFILLGALHLPALWTHVPYYPTPVSLYERIVSKLPTDTPFTFIDIGCGMGGLLRYASQQRPNGNFYGVEISVLPFLVSTLRSLGRKNLSVSFKSFWDLNLSQFDYIYAFLSPAPMEALGAKFKSEASDHTRLISNSFEIPDLTPSSVETVSKERGMTLFFYSRSALCSNEQRVAIH